jgi:hypothetical protein
MSSAVSWNPSSVIVAIFFSRRIGSHIPSSARDTNGLAISAETSSNDIFRIFSGIIVYYKNTPKVLLAAKKCIIIHKNIFPDSRKALFFA